MARKRGRCPIGTCNQAKIYFDDIPEVAVEPETLKLAEQILRSKATDFDPSQFVDRYEEAVVELLKKKQADIAVSRERTAPQPHNVVNITDALPRFFGTHAKG